MANLDPEKEHQRLADLYSSMSDEELQQIAAEAWSLSDLSHEALGDEIRERRSSITLNETPPSIEVPEKRDLVLLRRFRDLPEALFAKSALGSAGIECFLVDENIVRMDWFWSTLMGGIKLMVDPGNADEAAAILGQPIPESLAVEGVGEYAQPQCPECHSRDVSFQELRKGVAFSAAYFLNLPLPLHRSGWRCHACRHEWQANSDDAASVA